MEIVDKNSIPKRITRRSQYSYWAESPISSLSGKSQIQLEGLVSYLKQENKILIRQLKSKQIVIDIKTKEAANLKHVVDLLLDAAALVNIAMEGRG